MTEGVGRKGRHLDTCGSLSSPGPTGQFAAPGLEQEAEYSDLEEGGYYGVSKPVCPRAGARQAGTTKRITRDCPCIDMRTSGPGGRQSVRSVERAEASS